MEKTRPQRTVAAIAHTFWIPFHQSSVTFPAVGKEREKNQSRTRFLLVPEHVSGSVVDGFERPPAVEKALCVSPTESDSAAKASIPSALRPRWVALLRRRMRVDKHPEHLLIEIAQLWVARVVFSSPLAPVDDAPVASGTTILRLALRRRRNTPPPGESIILPAGPLDPFPGWVEDSMFCGKPNRGPLSHSGSLAPQQQPPGTSPRETTTLRCKSSSHLRTSEPSEQQISSAGSQSERGYSRHLARTPHGETRILAVAGSRNKRSCNRSS
ncbi:hypothetical protein JHW43_008011 [Diplocarpon mali]|nr:hypothetical protein JHW43_008011 [Diplocarpon mali]